MVPNVVGYLNLNRPRPTARMKKSSDQGIGSWLVCYEFEPSATEDPLCRGAMHAKSVRELKRPPAGLVW
ncbi:hypothetical protein TNCV_170761 [Trichonephila clavipes]|nr:hypothetical protein TNCV_170761 [Trichonephila clavipes]